MKRLYFSYRENLLKIPEISFEIRSENKIISHTVSLSITYGFAFNLICYQRLFLSFYFTLNCNRLKK